VNQEIGENGTVPTESHDRVEVVELTGEADLRTSSKLRTRLGALAERPRARVLVDLSLTTFIDSSTLGALAFACKQFEPGSGRFAVVCPPGEVRMMFELTGLERLVPIYSSRADALSAIPGAGGA
jgi:anti-anti-sigma factor